LKENNLLTLETPEQAENLILEKNNAKWVV
jgi:hypothetical protein